MTDLAQLISSAVKASGADDSINKQLTEVLKKDLNDYVSLERLKNKLEVLRKTILNLLRHIKKKLSSQVPYKRTCEKNVQNFFLRP